MSFFTDGINKIKNLILKNRNTLTIGSGNKDLILASKLNPNNMKTFEHPNNFNEYCREFFKKSKNFEKQLDYVEVLTKMQATGYLGEYSRYLQTVEDASNLYYPSEVHGINHTKRVLLFAEMLCMLDAISDHDRNLILTAAQLHDIGREDDSKNFDHGLSGKQKIERYGLLRSFPDRDAEIIKFAVECHSLSKDEVKNRLKQLDRKDRADYKRILDYLQDSDKLDRTRIANKGWGLDPERLTTDTAKKLVKIAHQNYYEYHNVMNYEKKREATDLYGNKIIKYFEDIRNLGFNISFDDFNNIISEYQPGVLEAYAESGQITELFSLKTFQKYRKEESFQDRINPKRIDPETMFQEINKKQQTKLLRETFEKEFMLYYSLKKHNQDAFDLLCYVDIEIPDMNLVGVANEIKISDLEKFNQNGCNFRMNDLFLLASHVTPEEYHNILQNGNIEDLYSIKYEKSDYNRSRVENELNSNGIIIDKEYFEKYYRLIEEIVKHVPEVFKEAEINNYTIPEIFAAVTKLNDAAFRIQDENQVLNYNFTYDSKNVIELLKYSRNTRVLENVSEDTQLDVVQTLATNKEVAQNPRFIEYILKKNKPYLTNNTNEILNYPEYCSSMILVDNNITLRDAKSKFINSLFNIDVPEEYKTDFEKEMMETLYYYQKYSPNSELQKQCGNFINVVNQICESKNINEFKNLLYNNMKMINYFNTNKIGEKIKEELMDYSKSDMVEKLQQTRVIVENLPSLEILSESGTPVKAKILTGQKFYISQSTAMPQCSYYTGKTKRENPGNEKAKIREAILKANIFRPETCDTIFSDEMVAHAASAFGDQEVKYAYFPESKEDISISAMYDLSSKKANGKLRVTQKPTTYRSIEDFVAGTIEEHNESVMKCIPDYIVCHDKITDIAIEQQEALNREYKKRNIDKNVEILLIPTKDVYIPRIKSKIEQEYNYVINKLETNNLTLQDFKFMFEKRESNIVTRTLQAIHSMSYRDDVWDITYVDDLIRKMTYVLEETSKIVPPEKSRVVLNQVNLLLERADTTKGFGTRYYDHTYAGCIDVNRLKNCKNILQEKNEPYENNKQVKQNNKEQERI